MKRAGRNPYYINIKQNKGPPATYTVNELLKSHNHEVLKLPSYHCDLNPIEKKWSLVKRRVAEKNLEQNPKNIVKDTEDVFASVTPDWAIQYKHVEHLEDEYFKNVIDEEMDRFIIFNQHNYNSLLKKIYR